MEGDLVLAWRDAQSYDLDPGGAPRSVSLPAQPVDGDYFDLANSGTDYEPITVKDSGGSTVGTVYGSGYSRFVFEKQGWCQVVYASGGRPFANPHVVNSREDFPPAEAGVITLADGTSWYISAHVDLVGDRIEADGIIALLGTSSETASLTSTGLTGQPLISTAHTMPARNITIKDVEVGVSVVSDGSAAIDWLAVNFQNCGVSAQITDVANFVVNLSAIIGGGFEFDGDAQTIAFTDCLIAPASGKIGISVPSTADVSRRLRATYSAVVVASGAVGVDVDADAIVDNETFILDTVNFSGSGTFLGDADATSVKALFTNCVGITNSATVGHYYMVGSSSATTITTQGAAVKIAGTTSSGPNVAKFLQNTANRAEYAGNISSFFEVSVTAALSSGSNNEIAIYVALNGSVIASSEMRATANGGGRAESIATYGVAQLTPGDYVEVFVANLSSTTDITATDLQVIVKQL